MEIYVVRPGDSVDSIARALDANVELLIYDNQLVYPYELAVGQALLVNGYAGEADRAAAVSGYAYPFISPWVLEQTLPFLTELRVFSYGFTEEGALLPPNLGDDAWMIAEAVRFDAMPILTLTPFGPDGNFNNRLIHSVVNNEAYTANLIRNLLDAMGEKGYVGVDIDFEYILAEDRDAFSDFVRQVAEAMREEGYQTSVALAPKTSADQEGLLYQGKDYRALGEAADHVLLMTYEWGYTYGPPMAVAPINQVRRVVEYALTEIPASKIDLGIPNYGYDWPLPFREGSRARSLSNVGAVRLAWERHAAIRYDEQAQAPWFRYVDGRGTEHEVWFEDARSIQAKLNLAFDYSLYGVGYWNLDRPFPQNWVVVNAMADIRPEM